MSEWQDGGRAARTERFRHALVLAESGQPEEAALHLRNLLDQPELGRRLRCKVHTVLSRLLAATAVGRALLHAEEAMRLAELVADPWLRADALAQAADLLLAHGDLARAREAVLALQQELVRQPGALVGGPGHGFWLLGRVLRACGEQGSGLAAFAQAEAMLLQTAPSGQLLWEVRAERAAMLQSLGRQKEARTLIMLLAQVTTGVPQARALELLAVEAVLGRRSDALGSLQRALQAAGNQRSIRARTLAWWARYRPEDAEWAERALSEAALSGRWDVAAEVAAILRPPAEQPTAVE